MELKENIFSTSDIWCRGGVRMELKVYVNGTICGKVSLRESGRRLHAEAVCSGREGIWRLYLLSDREILPLGVMLPAGGQLTLERTLTCPAGMRAADLRRGVLCPGDEKPSLPEPDSREAVPAGSGIPDRWMETERPESFTRDAVLQRTLPGAAGVLYRYRTGRVELAFPAEEHSHIAPALLLARVEEIRGETCYVLSFSGDGRPLPADMPSTY